jgi:excisionase family DNA binding protein
MLGIKEAAARLEVAEITTRRWIKDGILPHYRIGGRIKFDELDIENYKQSRRVEPVPMMQYNCLKRK